jgi:hypothetical protein
MTPYSFGTLHAMVVACALFRGEDVSALSAWISIPHACIYSGATTISQPLD